MNRPVIALVSAMVLFGSLPVIGQGTQQPAKPKAATAAAAADVVNLNTATVTQLATLPGIGPKTAELIVQYRQKNGSFKKIEEIMNVRGVGEKSFLKIKSRLTVAAPKAGGN